MKARWLLAAALCASAYGQNVFYSMNITQVATNVPAGANAPIYTVPNALVTVCGFPASGSPCNNLAQIFSDQLATMPLSQPVQADSSGRVQFWVAPGQYSYSVQKTNGQNVGTWPLSLTSPAGPSVPFIGAWSSSTIYLKGQSVSYNNQLYISLQDTNLNHQPDTNPSFWSNMISSGQVVTAPSSDQTISQPIVTGRQTTLSATSINGTLNEENFAGASIADRVNAASSACSSTPCGILIPPYAPIGTGWNLPLPGGTFLTDQRGLNNNNGFAAGQAPNLRSYIQYNNYRGADLPFESDPAGSGTFVMDLESSAYSGGNPADPGVSNMGSLLTYSERTAGSRPIWGQDSNIQCHNLNNYCTGIEVNMVNQGTEDDPGGTFRGILLTASSSPGGKILGSGLTIQAGGSGAFWKYPLTVQSYTDTGIRLLPQHSRTTDIGIVPFANDTNPEIIGRNAANTATVWFIDSVGNGNFTGLSSSILNTGTINATANITAASGTIASQNSVVSGALNVGGGVNITNTNAVPQVGTPTVGQVACIKAAGPPVLIGFCAGAVSGSGSCSCN